MNLLQHLALLAIVCNVMLTAFVLSRDLRSTVNRVYTLWGSSVVIWNIGVYFMFEAPDHDRAMGSTFYALRHKTFA